MQDRLTSRTGGEGSGLASANAAPSGKADEHMVEPGVPPDAALAALERLEEVLFALAAYPDQYTATFATVRAALGVAEGRRETP